jgi:hypothetical protein
MNIYLLEQNVNNDYDTFDAMVVCAPCETAARLMHPYDIYPKPNAFTEDDYDWKVWANTPEEVQVTLLGTSNNPTQEIILRSFNAG